MPNVVVVVLHYENEKMTNECVESVLRTAPEARILVVDNNSPTHYFTPHKNTIVVRNNDRHAVSGMNFGFMTALWEMEADYVVNIDNDVICLDGWLEPLVEAMEKDPKLGIVGGKQWTKDRTLHRSVGMDLLGGHLFANFPEEDLDVTWIQGSFVMMRGEMMRRIGVHDDRFKIICSDSDYCIHAKDRGWGVRFIAASEVIHLGGASYTKTVPTWEQDNKNLLQKWSGVAGMTLLKGFPLDYNKNKHLQAFYKMVEVPSAVQESEASKVDVQEQTKNGEGVVNENSEHQGFTLKSEKA